MLLFEASIAGEPVAKGRPRFNRKTGRTYTPAKTETWERQAAAMLASAWGLPPLTRPVSVTVRAIHARPDDQLPGPRVLRDHPELAGRLWRPRKPDLDNVEKAAWDALVLAGVLADDALVVHSEPFKLWTALGENPAVEIEIHTLPPGIAAMPRGT